jgi:hypothetical protein
MAGMITSSQISGSLDASDLVMRVLQKEVELSNLGSVIGTVQVPNLTGTIAIASPGSVSEDLEELEASDIEGGSFTNVSFDLKKDRIKFAISDEAGYKSRAGSPLDIQIAGGAQQLAAIRDKKAAVAIETTPQTGAAAAKWDTVSNNILKDIGTAVAGIRPYKADFIAMPKAVYTAYLQNDTIKDLAQGNIPSLPGAINTVPGFNLNIFVDDNLTAKSFTVGASGFCGVMGVGPVKVRTWDSEDLGATVYQMDVWRQAKAPIYKTSAGLNAAAYKITAAIS